MGDLLEEELSGVDGRGDCRPPPPNIPHLILSQLLTEHHIHFEWEVARRLSGKWSGRPRPKNTNWRIHALHAEGYKTTGDICSEEGIAKSTLHRWDGTVLPKLPRVDGYVALSPSAFAKIAEAIRSIKRRARYGCDEND